MSTKKFDRFTSSKVDPPVFNSLSLLAFLHYCPPLVHFYFCPQFIIFKTYFTYIFTCSTFNFPFHFTFSCCSVLFSCSLTQKWLIRFPFRLCAHTSVPPITGKTPNPYICLSFPSTMIKILWNISRLLPDNPALQPRRQFLNATSTVAIIPSLNFKWPAFTHANTYKNHIHEMHFIYLDNKENFLHC